MPITQDQLRSLAGSGGNVVSTSGEKIGGVGQIYLDDSTGEPSWVTVKTGLFGTSESFVPLQGADVQGDDIVVSYDKATVKDAPRVADDGSISPEEEDQLYAYYNVGSGVSADHDGGADHSTTTATTGVTSGDYDRGAEFDAGAGRGPVGNDVSGQETDDAMTRSEERLRVGTQQREAGRARLRKYIVTENVSTTVPVSREEVRVTREPITEANIGNATSGPDLSEEEHEVILHEETPVVAKETVPVERVRLDTETVTEQVQVSEQVRKEQIETDLDEGRTR